MTNWLKDRLDTATKVATIFGLPIAIGGLFFTGFQLREYSRAVEASTVYQLQKDGRTLSNSIANMEKFRSYLTSQKSQKINPDFDAKIREIIQFYSAVALQRKANVIRDVFWTNFLGEICLFYTQERIIKLWKVKVLTSNRDEYYKKIIGTC